MAECSASSHYNSLKSSVQWLFSYWWPILEWKQGKFSSEMTLAAHRVWTHLHLCKYLMSSQWVIVMMSELNFALSSLEYGSSVREWPPLKFSHFSTSYNSWIYCTLPLRLTFCQPKVWPEWASRAACSLMLGSVTCHRCYVYQNKNVLCQCN